MIGCRCKRREALSRAVLIGRALLPTMRGSGSERSSWEVRLVALCGPQGTAEPAPEPKNAPSWSATMAGEAHLVPFRTQKLSPRAPMVLRSESVGEQDVADQRGAFYCSSSTEPWQGCQGFLHRGYVCCDQGLMSDRLADADWIADYLRCHLCTTRVRRTMSTSRRAVAQISCL